MKVVFITLNLGKGGAEKVFTSLVKNLHSVFDISVVSIHGGGYYENEIKQLGLDYYTLGGPNGNTFLYVSRFHKILKEIEPTVVISFLWYPNIISGLATLNSKIKLIVSERSNHRIYLNSDFKKKNIWKPLLKFVYKKSSLIIPNSIAMGENIKKDFKVNSKKVKVIHNGICFDEIDELMQHQIEDFVFNPDIRYVISVGRLNEPKNYTFLLKSFEELISKVENVELIILGEGDLRKSLIEEAKVLGIYNKLHLLGFKSNPYKYLKRADCYVMSSKREGFPNALIEAMYVNGNVVSTDCETGPNEIITHRRDGFLVGLDSSSSMAEAIKILLLDKVVKENFYIESRKKLLAFTQSKMIDLFKESIDEVGH